MRVCVRSRRSARARISEILSRSRSRGLGAKSKANHLSYIGDADIGRGHERRRRHDHLQLRRQEQTPDDDRRECFCRQRLDAGGAARDCATGATSRRARRLPRTCRRMRWRWGARGRRPRPTGRRRCARGSSWSGIGFAESGIAAAIYFCPSAPNPLPTLWIARHSPLPE